MKASSYICTMLICGFLGPVALADDYSSYRGKITESVGPENSALILRGTTSFALSDGDKLLDGDTVVTRANGRVRISLSDCEIDLPEEASLVINEESCHSSPTPSASINAIGGAIINFTNGAVPSTAAPVIAGVAATGVAASAVTGSGNSTPKPTSP